MRSISKQVVRIALMVMLFQFVCPAFISIVVQQIPTSKEVTLSAQHTSIVAPMLLKEKDEQENEEYIFITNSAPLLDFTSHSSNLTASHNDKSAAIMQGHSPVQPPLFTMFCTLQI